MKNFFTRLGLYSIPPLMIIGAGYFHLKSLIAKNKKEFLTTYEKSRDTTRPGNKSFGLNYGYKTDSAVKFT